MARIKFDAKTWTNEYNMMRAQSDAQRENNDCTVVACAAVTGLPYAQVHAALAKRGRKERKGCQKWQQWDALHDLGFSVTQVPAQNFISRYPGAHKNLKSVTTHHMHRFNKVWADGNKYLVYTRGHVAAVIDGVNHDWTRGRAKRVVGVYVVTKK